MSDCACPLVDVPLNAIPADPIRCANCGGELRITCPGECGEKHVAKAIAAAAPASALPPGRLRRSPSAPRVYLPKPCRRCGREFTPKSPNGRYCGAPDCGAPGQEPTA